MSKLAKLMRYFTAEDEPEKSPRKKKAKQPETAENDTERDEEARKQ